MPEFFSSDGSFFLQFVVIFLVILILLMGAVLLFRRLAGRSLSLSARAVKTGRQPRLGIVDIYELDSQRQLILLRRDNVEHLLLVGGPNDVVVERNIQRGSRLPSESLLWPEPETDDEAQPPAPLGGQTEEQDELPPVLPPSFNMPLIVPPPLPDSRSQAAVQAPSLDSKMFAPDEAEAEAPPPARPRTGRLLRRTPPPLVEPRPEPASERLASAPPVMATSDPRPVDPAVLSDMARQLEVALRRPSSAVTPPPRQTSGSAETPPPPVAEPRESAPHSADPVAAGRAATQAPSPVQPEAGTSVQVEPHAAPATTPSAPSGQQPASQPGPEADTTKNGLAAAGAKPRPAEPSKPAALAPEREGGRIEDPCLGGKDAAAPQPTPALFSAEEIEAEFARLLGRPFDKKP